VTKTSTLLTQCMAINNENSLPVLLLSIVSANNSFVVSARGQAGQTYTLLANDELDKRHWLQHLRAAVQSQPETSTPQVMPELRASNRRHRRSAVGDEEANISIGSCTSYTSLSSVFSTNSATTIGSEFSFHSLEINVKSKLKDLDSDSGIVT
jgi:hypothetical protein